MKSEPSHQRGRLSSFRRAALRILVAAAVGLGAVAVVQAPANAAAGTSTLYAGEELTSGQYLIDGNFQLTMQSDGNLVMRACGHEVWATSTWGHAGAYLIMQYDGNLVIYSNGTAIWNTATNGHSGAYVVMQGDSNMVVYSGSTALWSSGTMGAGDCSDRLFDDQTMTQSTPLWSLDHNHEFYLSNYGIFILNVSRNVYTWNNTSCGAAAYGAIRSGDFEVFTSAWVETCHTNTSSPGDTYLMMQKDGNLVLYTDYKSPLWSSGTAGQ